MLLDRRVAADRRPPRPRHRALARRGAGAARRRCRQAGPRRGGVAPGGADRAPRPRGDARSPRRRGCSTTLGPEQVLARGYAYVTSGGHVVPSAAAARTQGGVDAALRRRQGRRDDGGRAARTAGRARAGKFVMMLDRSGAPGQIALSVRLVRGDRARRLCPVRGDGEADPGQRAALLVGRAAGGLCRRRSSRSAATTRCARRGGCRRARAADPRGDRSSSRRPPRGRSRCRPANG